MKTMLVLPLLLLLALGCGNGGDYEADMSRPEAAPGKSAPGQSAQPAAAPAPGRTAPEGAPTEDRAGGAGAGIGATAAPAPDVQRQIIRSGSISLIVESLDSAQQALGRVVSSLGGYTANASRSRISGATMTGTVETRVPSARFDALLAAARRLGRVDSENIAASDVTQEYIDLEARLKGQQQLEERILKLLAERPGKLADIVEIEQKLADVRSTIEGIQGRLRFFRSQIDFSTLTVTMTEPGAVGTSETETFGGRIADAFNEGIDGLVGLTAGLVTLVMVLLPMAAIGLLLLWAYKAWRRSHPASPKGRPPVRKDEG